LLACFSFFSFIFFFFFFPMSRALVAFAAVLAALIIALPAPESEDPRADPLFAEYPAIGSVSLSNGVQTSAPFHSRNATSLVFWGTAARKAVEPLLRGSSWAAVTLASDPDRVMAQVWVVKYFDTTAGPYEEVIASLIVQPRTAAADAVATAQGSSVDCSNSYCHISHLFLREGTHCFLHKLWLNETNPILYGRELLGANKFKADFRDGFLSDGRTFDVRTADGEVIVRGAAPEVGGGVSQWLLQYPRLLWGMGIRDAVTMLFSTALRGTAVGPRGVIAAGREGVFESVFRVGPLRRLSPSFASVDPASIEFGPELAAWDLRLDTLTRFDGFRFVLLLPWA
jgi:hypothetical protein